MYLDTSKDALLFLLCLLSILQEKCSKGFPLKSAFHKTKKIITILDKYQQQGTCNNKIPCNYNFIFSKKCLQGEQKCHSYGYPAVCCDLLYAGSNSHTGYLTCLILNQLQFFD